jgi:hypothetical protein
MWYDRPRTDVHTFTCVLPRTRGPCSPRGSPGCTLRSTMFRNQQPIRVKTKLNPAAYCAVQVPLHPGIYAVFQRIVEQKVWVLHRLTGTPLRRAKQTLAASSRELTSYAEASPTRAKHGRAILKNRRAPRKCAQRPCVESRKTSNTAKISIDYCFEHEATKQTENSSVTSVSLCSITKSRHGNCHWKL